MSAMQWMTDQYRMALNEAYLPALSAIPDRIRSDELTPSEGRSLFELYEKTKVEMDRHINHIRIPADWKPEGERMAMRIEKAQAS